MSVRFASITDEEICYLLDRKKCQNTAKQIMCLDERTVTPREKCKILVYHMNEIVAILTDEKDDDYLGPYMRYAIDEEIFQILYIWSSESPGSLRELLMRTEQLRIYRSFIDKCKSSVLLCEQIWKPLLFLLHSCKTYGVTEEMEFDFVAVLKSLCVCVNREIALLDLFFLENHHENGVDCLSVFSMLIPYLHRGGEVGEWARDAVLLCMALSSVDHRLGNYIIENTNFCPVSFVANNFIICIISLLLYSLMHYLLCCVINSTVLGGPINQGFFSDDQII